MLVWQKAIVLSDVVYEITSTFPKDEVYGLSSQLQRSVVSVASNIAEGAARQGTKEFIHFLSMAKASLAEIDTQITIALRRKYLQDEERLYAMLQELDRMIFALIKKLNTKNT